MIHRLRKFGNHRRMALHSGKQSDHCVAKPVPVCRRKELVFIFCVLPLSTHVFHEKEVTPVLENTYLAP